MGTKVEITQWEAYQIGQHLSDYMLLIDVLRSDSASANKEWIDEHVKSLEKRKVKSLERRWKSLWIERNIAYYKDHPEQGTMERKDFK